MVLISVPAGRPRTILITIPWEGVWGESIRTFSTTDIDQAQAIVEELEERFGLSGFEVQVRPGYGGDPPRYMIRKTRTTGGRVSVETQALGIHRVHVRQNRRRPGVDVHKYRRQR